MSNTTFSGPVVSNNGFSGPALATGPGTGIGTRATTKVTKVGNLITTHIYVDLQGLNSAATADIIGAQGAANCHLGRITTAECGVLVSGSVTCLEAPVTGDTDIDLYSATEATGTEDAAVTGLTETALLAAGSAWTLGESQALTGLPANNEYLYLSSGGAGADATYTAGKLLIELKGYAA